MKAAILICLLCCSFFLKAQKITKKTELPEEFINIKLAKFPIADFPDNSIAVSDIRIAQMVRDSVNVGYALKGGKNQIANLKISKPLTDFLQAHIYRMYKHDFTKEGIKMFWVLKDLRIGEKTAFIEYSYCRMNMEGYVSTDGALYKKEYMLDTVYVAEGNIDFTKWHGEEIEKGLNVFSKRMLLYAESTLAGNSPQKNIDEILSQSYQDFNYPILKDTVYNEGAYLNFEEFLQNKPSIKNFVPVLTGNHNIKFTKINFTGFADTLNIWGLCKESEIYKYYEETLIPIEKQGTGFIISDFIKNSNKHNRSLAYYSSLAGVGGGMIAEAVVGMVADKIKIGLLPVKSIPYIPQSSTQPVASCIDMKTGNLSF